MSDAQWLIITGFVLILGTGIACLVYGVISMWLVMKYPDVTKRMERMEEKWDTLKSGMQRAGTWESTYERKTPDHLKINKDSA